MTKLWFAAKRYGYGWYPITWQGWLITGIFLLAILAPTSFTPWMNANGISQETFAYWYVPYCIALTIILILICRKTGEPARWRWGK